MWSMTFEEILRMRQMFILRNLTPINGISDEVSQYKIHLIHRASSRSHRPKIIQIVYYGYMNNEFNTSYGNLVLTSPTTLVLWSVDF